MSYYKKKYTYKKKNFLNSEEISDNSICLPVGPHISLKDCKYIFDNLNLSPFLGIPPKIQ